MGALAPFRAPVDTSFVDPPVRAAPPPIRRALGFDAIGDFVDIENTGWERFVFPGDSALGNAATYATYTDGTEFDADFTMGIWVKITDVTVSCYVFNFGVGTATNYFRLRTAPLDASTCEVRLEHRGMPGYTIDTSLTGVLNLDQWHYIAGRRSGDDISLWVDGVNTDEQTTSVRMSNPDRMFIGSRNNDVWLVGEAMRASLDVRALSDAEMLTRYTQGRYGLYVGQLPKYEWIGRRHPAHVKDLLNSREDWGFTNFPIVDYGANNQTYHIDQRRGPLTNFSARNWTGVFAFKNLGIGEAIFSLGSSTDDNNYFFIEAVNNGGAAQLQVRVRDTTATVNVTLVDPAVTDCDDGNWHFLAVSETENGANQDLRVSLDGGAVFSTSYAYASGPDPVGLDMASLGRLGRATPNRYFGGLLGWAGVDQRARAGEALRGCASQEGYAHLLHGATEHTQLWPLDGFRRAAPADQDDCWSAQAEPFACRGWANSVVDADYTFDEQVAP